MTVSHKSEMLGLSTFPLSFMPKSVVPLFVTLHSHIFQRHQNKSRGTLRPKYCLGFLLFCLISCRAQVVAPFDSFHNERYFINYSFIFQLQLTKEKGFNTSSFTVWLFLFFSTCLNHRILTICLKVPLHERFSYAFLQPLQPLKTHQTLMWIFKGQYWPNAWKNLMCK